MNRLDWIRWLLLLVALTGPATYRAAAQVLPSDYDYPRSGLDWYTIETEHFNVIFHADSSGRGSSRTAQSVARIAEEVYGPITSLYEYEPDTKVSFILKDFEDYSNGAAYFFDNKIEIWAPALDSPLRGDHNWLRNVITHEFTHIIQVQKTMKAGRRMPFLYFQLMDYEEVKRPDVLYGYPNVIVTYPIPVLNNPAWLAEGTAQYQRTGLHYDTWDTHRDMLLRTQVLAGKELSLEEMGGFYSHTSLMREGVYNHGHAFTRYIARRFGEDGLRRLSASLGKWKNWNVERAFKDAFGIRGDKVYDDWMTTLRKQYETNTSAIRAQPVEGDLVEAEGFFNFYPRFSPDGRRLAYVSNRKEDFSRTALYVLDLETGELAEHFLEGFAAHAPVYTCSFGHRIVPVVGNGISWHPDGGRIVYSRTRDTRYGYYYADLYAYDFGTRKSTRLTYEQRASMPAYSPDGAAIVFVTQGDGTTNLALYDAVSGDVKPLTSFEDGRQVSDPVWHPLGEWIYFAMFSGQSRDLYRVRPDGTGLEAVRATEADERSPAIDPTGTFLYFSSDASGIFNLYRVPIETADNEPERLTNVLGGAFMSDVSPAGRKRIAYAHYQWDGYKIALLDLDGTSGAVPDLAYTPPEVLQKPVQDSVETFAWADLNTRDELDVRALSGESLATLRTEGRVAVPEEDEPKLEAERYRSLFTSFSVYPVLRFDQYVDRQRGRLDASLGRRSAGETLLRNTKVGAYVSSREVLEGFSMLGGLLVSPASTDAESLGGFVAPSNLLDLERDAFLQFDYKKGFGFIPQRWSPQFSVEVYNIRRNVESGLSIEEFPCTACYPDTTYTDLAYTLFEADLIARSKVNRSTLLEVGYRYSPYRVTTDRFFSREANMTIAESSQKYYIGKALWLKAYFDLRLPHRDEDVIPEGLRAEATFEYEPGRLLDRFDIKDGMLVPLYEQFNNRRLILDTRFGKRLPGRINGGAHGIGIRLRGSTILGGEVDSFFNDYVGGLIGARGYPFYALGGNETLWLQASYLLPIVPRVNRQLLFLYVDKVYARLYADAAYAWSGAWPGLDAAKKDVGAELRVGIGSFYLLPTALFVSATYGFDAFDFKLDDGFVTPEGRTTVPYGKELQWHFGILFSFDL